MNDSAHHPICGSINRRHALVAGAGLALSPLLARFAGAQSQASAPATSNAASTIGEASAKAFRLIHMTDIHVQPELDAQAGAAQAMAHAQSLRPDLIVTGGDTVMDVFGQKRPRATELHGCARTLLNDVGTPMIHCTGNHDVLGWNRSRSDVPTDAADYGKKFACELFGIPRNYYRHDAGGWRILVLDSVRPDENGYKAYLDDAQRAWFEAELAETPVGMPVCVVSHVPILSITCITYGKAPARAADTIVSGGEMHTDCAELHDLMRVGGKVKLCLSGHVHLLDRCATDGITYICDGAVCGNWWKGTHDGVREGFGIVDLRPDGSFDHRYETYGWIAKA